MSDTLDVSAPITLDELHELTTRPSDGVVELAGKLDSDILVLGAGGKMGFHVCRMLQRALESAGSKHQVIAVSRFGGEGATERFDAREIKTISADLTEESALKKLPESNNIFFMAGIKFGTNDNPELLQQMNVELPRRVARRYSDPAVRIVALSTGCVYEFVSAESGGSIESDELNPPGEYAKSCVGRERAFYETEAKVSLVRLNYSVDLRYGVLVDVARQVINEEPIDVSTGFVNVIWQGDAVNYTIRSLEHASNPPFVINVTGEKTLAVQEVATRFGELLGKEVRFVGEQQEKCWLNNADKSHGLWGRPKVDEERLIAWVADWVANHRPMLSKPTQFQVRDGKY